MIRISTLIALPCLVIASSRGLAQTRETPQARAAYAKVVAMRNDFERALSLYRQSKVAALRIAAE